MGPPPRRRRWPTVLAGAVAIAGVLAYALNGSSPPPPPVVSSSAPAVEEQTPAATPTPGTTELGRAVLGVTRPYELFGRGAGFVVRVEFARGRATITQVPALASTGPVSFVLTRRGALVRPLDYVSGYLVPDGRPAQPLTGSLAENGPIWSGPSADSVWQAVGSGSDTALQLTDLTGRRSGPAIPVPEGDAFNVYGDGIGGLVRVQSEGADFLRGRRWATVPDERVVAIGPARVLTAACGAGTCRLRLRDLEGRRPRDVGSRPEALLGGSWGSPAGRLSPGARFVALPASEPATAASLRVVDLREGRDVFADTEGEDVTDLAWAPDARWLFVVTRRGDLRAVDPATGSVHGLGLGLPALAQLVIRSG